MLKFGENELRGLGDGLAQALGLQPIARDMGIAWGINIYTDATAAIGIARPRGMCCIRHLDVTDLWIQEKFNSEQAFLHEVAGSENPANLLTKYTDRNVLNRASKKMGLKCMDGRSAVAPAAIGTTSKTTAQ